MVRDQQVSLKDIFFFLENGNKDVGIRRITLKTDMIIKWTESS